MPRPLPVIYCFPRSGGTLLSQCLLCAKSTVILSEVNPAASFLAIEHQAQEWFGLVTAKEATALKSQPYAEQVVLLDRRCNKKARQLCLRDWVAINFIPGLTPLVPVPSGVLEQRLFLQQAGFELREIAFLRRSRDIFDSLRRHMPGFSGYALNKFAAQYRAYLEALGDIPKFHLEEFTRNPTTALRQICQVLGLEYPAGFEQQFHAKQSVTGNNLLETKPPSAALTRIKAMPTRQPKRSTRDHATFAALDLLAGYATAP